MRRALAARLHRSEDGSALVLALLVVLLVGTLLAAALDYSRTGLTAVPQLRNDRNEVATVESAVDGAINRIRGSSVTGRTSAPACPDFVPPLPSGLPGVDATESFRVTCQAQATGGSAADGAPPYAIHALGSAPEGIRQVNPSNHELVVLGGIYSRGVISVGGGSQSVMTVYGTAVSETSNGCSGRLFTTDVEPMCGPSHALSDGADPGYGSSIPDQAALQAIVAAGTLDEGADPVPSCSGGVATFRPGHYGERPDRLIERLLPSCSASVWRFAPGRYHFDYDGVWDLGTKRVIAGTAGTSTVLGDGCSRTSPGVQFVFGGDSRVYTRSSASADNGIEICGPAKGEAGYWNGAGTPQRIAVYGLTTANAVGSATSSTANVEAGTGEGLGAWTARPSARLVDAQHAAVLLQKNEKASLEWRDFGTAPKGSRVAKVLLELHHTPANIKKADISLTGPGGLNVVESVSGCTVCRIDVTAALEARRTDVMWRYLDELRVGYEVEGKDDQPLTAAGSLVDGVRLVVEHSRPVLRALTCGPGCTFFESTNNPNVYMHGTVYTPSAAWAVNVHNSGESIFDRGVVLRDLAVNVSGSSKQTSSPFQLPFNEPTGRKVLFRGYVDGVERVRACVRYTDVAPLAGSSDSVAFPGWSLTVTQWLTFRNGPTAAVTCPG